MTDDRDLTAVRVTKGTAWATAETWGLQLVQFLTFLALARLLGPEVYGLVGIALSVNVLGEALIVEGGWIEAIVQRRDLDRRHLDAIFWTVLGLGVGMGILGALGAALVADLYGQPQLAPLMAVLAGALPLRSLSIVPEALLCRRLKFAPLAARSLLSVAIAGAIGIGLAVTGAGVWSLAAYHLVQPCAGALLIWRSVEFRPAAALSLPSLRAMMPFVGTTLANRVVGAADTLLPRLFIGYFRGAGPVGHYTMARKLMEVATQFLTRPLTRVGLSTFAAGGGPELIQQRFTWAIKLGSATAWPGFLGLAIVAPDIVALVLGRGWEEAARALQILALAGPAWATTRICAALLYGRGYPIAQLLVDGAGLLLLAALFAGGSALSMPQLAGLVVLRSFLLLPLVVYLVARTTGVRPLQTFSAVWPVFIATGAMVALTWGLRDALPAHAPDLVRLLASGGAGAAAYVAILGLLARPLLLDLAGSLGLGGLLPRRPHLGTDRS